MASQNDDNNHIDQPDDSNENQADDYDVSADGSIFTFSLTESSHIVLLGMLAYGLTLLAIVLVKLFGNPQRKCE